MRFEFATATRILFGEGVSREVPAAAAAMGRRALVVTGASARRAALLIAELERAGVACVRFPVSGEPTVELVAEGAVQGRGACDVVIAIGGGSAIDAGKAIAAMLTNPGEPLDYLEVIGRERPLENASAPFIAVPTTAGTGSEVTRNAVLASHEKGVKASLRSAGMLPRLAVVDPELTLDLPRPITAAAGMDALTQVIEPYTSARANPMVDMFCIEGIRRGAAALPRAWENGSDREARREMAWVSLLGGLSLANAGLGAAHGFAAVLGGAFRAPHGAICAAMIPHVIEVNVRALRSRAPQHPALARYEEVARIVTGRSYATPEDGARWVAELGRRLEIPPLRAYGVNETHIPDLVENAARASSMKANPIAPTTEELREMVSAAI
jgi:alcohol dehydrogenase class IV